MKILIVDDHALVRTGLSAVLRQAVATSVILEAGNFGDALLIAARHVDIDIVLLDLMLPDTRGVDMIEQFGRQFPSLPILVLSSSENEADVRKALDRGALGYVPKSASAVTLMAALRLVLEGEIYVPAFMAKGLAPNPAPETAGLTARQAEILHLIAANVPNKEISHRLAISEKTVKAHVTSIFKALNVANRAQAAQRYLTYNISNSGA
jgi:DNA-binding NarL/FixJ family response regulator